MGCTCMKPKNKLKNVNVSDSNNKRTKTDVLKADGSYSKNDPSDKLDISYKKEKLENPPQAATPPIVSEPTVTFPCGKFSLPELIFYDFDTGLKSGEFERSRPTDWHNLLKKTFNFTCANIYDIVPKFQENPVIHSFWDKKLYIDLPAKLLAQPPMEWFKEQIYLLKRTLQPGNDIGKVSIQRKIIQLSEQFKWFGWAVGCYLYISLSTGEKHIGKHFSSMSGLQEEIMLPKRIKDWLGGFRYKNVRFKLVLLLSDEGRMMRAEIKSMRIFNLSYGQIAGSLNYFIIFPMMVYMRIGPYLLFSVPIYPQNFLTDGPSLNMDIFPKPINISETNVFKIVFETEEKRNPRSKEIPTCYLLYNFNTFVPESRKIQYLCFFTSIGKEISIYESNFSASIPKSVLLDIMYAKDNKNHNAQIKTFEAKIFGWNCYVYYEENHPIQKKNSRASLFGKEITGDAVVSFHLNKKNYKRFPVYNLEGKNLINVLRKNIRDCMGILETSEDICNVNSLKELLHRKGLNYRHEWIIYSKCRNEKTQTLVESDLLARAVWKVVCHLLPAFSNYSSYCSILVKVLGPLLNPKNRNFEPLLHLSLFMERLKSLRDATKIRKNLEESASRIIDPFKQKKHSYEYLSSNEMLEKIISVGSRYPAQFLEAVEYHCKVQFNEDLIASCKCDGYYFLQKNKTINLEDIFGFQLSVYSISSLREENCITLLGFLERGGPKGSDSRSILNDSFGDWISDANVDLVNKEEEHHSLEVILPCDLYSYCGSSLFREFYEFPALAILEEWSNCVETLVKDLITVDGGENVLVEILIYVITQRYFIDMDSVRCYNILNQIQTYMNESIFVPAEIVIAYYLWTGIAMEQQNLAQSEQNYISALILMTKLQGDPRGRKNRGIPWQMLAAWKISQIAREYHRLPDAMAAEEHFDSVFMGTKEFQQNLIRILKARNSSSKQAEVVLKHPFDHWSLNSDKRESLVPESFDEFCTWMINHSLTLYQSGKLWSNLYTKLILKGTLLPQFPTNLGLSMSGASTPNSFRESRKALQQSSLTQILIPENGAINLFDMKGVGYIWGTDRHGQLGLASIDDEELPDQVTLPYPRMLTSLKDHVIKEISAGAEHCIAITIEGNCFAWGKNDNSQLGLGPDNPPKVKYPVMIKSVSHIRKASCGYEHTVLLAIDNRVYTMGLGEGGVLGHGNVLSVMYPKLVQSLKSIKIKKIACGGYHTTALDKEGHLYVWGRGEGGQLGLDPDQLLKTMKELKIESSETFIHTPQRLFGELTKKKIINVACGEAHTLALTDEKEVYGWGWGSNGQLGRGLKHDDFEEIGNKLCIRYLPSIIEFPEGTVVKQIAAGGLFSMFITEENEVLACGMNDFGQLGIENPHRDHTDISFPSKLDCFSGYPIDYLVCGENHTVAVSGKHESVTWAWGRYREGQLGLGEVSPSATPRPVQTLNNAPVYKIACGRRHTFAVIGKPRFECKIHKKEPMEFGIVFSKIQLK
jgi:alpha-tubulin suppressor-like RCC1 family protein